MRLWSLHPRHLDVKGLVALWREGLLAKAVLKGNTKGYTNHPQLLRFKRHPRPLKALNYYLLIIHEEATKRGYAFDKTKIKPSKHPGTYPITKGQYEYEQVHLQKKLAHRNKNQYTNNRKSVWAIHPLFTLIEGTIEDWEKT